MRSAEAFLAALWHLEETLIAAGFPPMPAWWRETIERFERSGKRRRVIRKGRRVFASTCVAPRLAVAEMLFGQHPHLRGTPPHVYAFLSVKRDEASKRLHGIRAILDVLSEPYTERGDTIELTKRPAVFAVVTANYRVSVGDTIAFCWCDEVARWRDDESGANPSEEVIGSLAPALATLPDAHLWLVSSPLSTMDFHARSFDLGETEQQAIAFGASWTINPTLTEEGTHTLEPNARLWSREWAAIPQGAITQCWDFDLVSPAFGKFPERRKNSRWVLLVDPSSGRKDGWAYGLAAWCHGETVPEYLIEEKYIGHGITTRDYLRDEDGQPIQNPAYAKTQLAPRLRLAAFGTIENARAQGFTAQGIIRDLVYKLCRPNGVSLIVGDSHENWSLEGDAAKYGLRYVCLPWTNPTKKEAVERLTSWFRDGVISIADDEPQSALFKRQLIQFDEKIDRNGVQRFEGRGVTHDDLVSLALLAARADDEGLLPATPYRAARPRGMSAADITRILGGGEPAQGRWIHNPYGADTFVPPNT